MSIGSLSAEGVDLSAVRLDVAVLGLDLLAGGAELTFYRLKTLQSVEGGSHAFIHSGASSAGIVMSKEDRF